MLLTAAEDARRIATGGGFIFKRKENKHMSNVPELQKLLRDSTAEYEKIADDLRRLMRGEVSTEEVNAVTDTALKNVDNLIEEYR